MATKNELHKIDGHEVISKQVAKLRAEKDKLIHSFGFLEATISNPNTTKLDASFSGHALDGLIKSNAQVMCMGICRIWDQNPPRPLAALEMIGDRVDGIEAARKCANPDWPDAALQIGQLSKRVGQTLRLAQAFSASSLFGRIRVFRTEYLAHALDTPSRDRKKFMIDPNEESVVSFRELSRAGQISLKIIDRIISHWEFHVENSFQSLQVQTRYALMFWDALPKLDTVERPELLND